MEPVRAYRTADPHHRASTPIHTTRQIALADHQCADIASRSFRDAPSGAVDTCPSRMAARIDTVSVLAREALSELPDRWVHTQAVGVRAAAIAGTVDLVDRPVLLAAAWLHDIGYAPIAVRSGFHQLGGARLAQRLGWPLRIVALIAHHSGAIFVARGNGWADSLLAYPDEQSPVTDALLYADQSTGSRGEFLPAAERIERSLSRHGPRSAQARVAPQRGAFLLESVTRVQRQLAQATIPDRGGHTAADDRAAWNLGELRHTGADQGS